MHLWNTYPTKKLTLVHGKGCTVWDTNGKAYLDLLAGTWCNILGYAHPRWVAEIQEQTPKFVHSIKASVSKETIEALDELSTILPPELNRAFFLNTGSEAVEAALKIARAATGGESIIVIEKGYYGATIYSLSLSEAGRMIPYLPHYDTIQRISAPQCKQCTRVKSIPCSEFQCIEEARSIINAQGYDVAAVIYEPVMGVGGMLIPPDGYGAQLRELANEFNALLISEEVTTGMGRTGRWFGFQHDDIVPDILVVGKAIGAGYPVSAVVTTEEVETKCRGTVYHLQSHQNDPLSCKIAHTVISIIKEETLIDQVVQRSDHFEKKLLELQARNDLIDDIRVKGLMIGIEVKENGDAAGEQIANQLFKDGYILDFQSSTQTFRLFPPYVISESEINGFIEAFENALSALY